jgi:hypothetical protein
MKINKHIFTFLVAAMTATSSFAQTKIYITGSTAFRGAAVPAISATLAGTVSIAYDGNSSGVTSQNNANAVTWTGGNIGGTAVTIKASWSGSAAGIQTVAGAPDFNVRFLPDGATGSANSDPRNTANPAELAVPDVCMTDVFQGASPFNGTFNGHTYASLTDNTVGVVSFVWAASKNFPLGTGSAPVSSYSFTPQLAQALFPIGAIPLSMISGNTSDRTVGVYATGRDPDSGTRLTAMAESGVGVSTFLQQWKPTVSSGTITALTLYPVQTINGVSTVVDGNSGEASGSTLRGYLTNTLTAAAYQTWSGSLTNGFLLTYLGVGDFNNVSAGGAVQLLYNGVPFSQGAIEEGRYTFWGYEHLDYKSNLGNGSTGGPAVKLTFATNLKNNIAGSTSATLNPNVSLSDMQVQRFADGGTVTPISF